MEGESGLRVGGLSCQLKASVWVMSSSMSHNVCRMMEVHKGVGRKWQGRGGRGEDSSDNEVGG